MKSASCNQSFSLYIRSASRAFSILCMFLLLAAPLFAQNSDSTGKSPEANSPTEKIDTEESEELSDEPEFDENEYNLVDPWFFENTQDNEQKGKETEQKSKEEIQNNK